MTYVNTSASLSPVFGAIRASRGTNFCEILGPALDFDFALRIRLCSSMS